MLTNSTRKSIVIVLIVLSLNCLVLRIPTLLLPPEQALSLQAWGFLSLSGVWTQARKAVATLEEVTDPKSSWGGWAVTKQRPSWPCLVLRWSAGCLPVSPYPAVTINGQEKEQCQTRVWDTHHAEGREMMTLSPPRDQPWQQVADMDWR